MDSAAQQLANFITVTAPDYAQYQVFSNAFQLGLALVVGIAATIVLVKIFRFYRKKSAEYEPKFMGDTYSIVCENEGYALAAIISVIVLIICFVGAVISLCSLAGWILYPDASLMNIALSSLKGK